MSTLRDLWTRSVRRGIPVAYKASGVALRKVATKSADLSSTVTKKEVLNLTPRHVPSSSTARTIQRLRTVLAGSVKIPKIEEKSLDNFAAFYTQCRAQRRLDEAYAAASKITKRSSISPQNDLVWICALSHYTRQDDPTQFKEAFYDFLRRSSNIAVLTKSPLVLRRVVQVAIQDKQIMEKFRSWLRHPKETWDASSRSIFYALFLAQLKISPPAQASLMLEWHDELLIHNFRQKKGDLLEIFTELYLLERIPNMLESIIHQYEDHKINFDFYKVVALLCKQKRYSEADALFRFLLNNGRVPETSKHLDDLLDHHLRYSNRETVTSFLCTLKKRKIRLTHDGDCALARTWATEGRYQELRSLSERYKDGDATEQDHFWASALRGARAANRSHTDIMRILKVQGTKLGAESLQICVEAAGTQQGLYALLDTMLRNKVDITLRGYAVCVRFIARQGRSNKAWQLMNSSLRTEGASQADLSFLKRNLILGLLEGKHVEELERRHRDMDVAGMATRDTWNLLLRCRIVEGKVKDAVSGLKEMHLQGIEVENATAQEFVFAILRPRPVGGNPDVLNGDDKRPYLSDIKMAIAVTHRCLSLGGRVQPETWREIMKRLGLYGEFETLDRLTAWLIYQYDTTPLEPGARARLYHHSPTQLHLPHAHPQHPLNRLIRPVDVAATVTRGFRKGKPERAVALVMAWKAAGIAVSTEAVERRISAGLEYMASRPRAKNEDVEALRRSLTVIVARGVAQS